MPIKSFVYFDAVKTAPPKLKIIELGILEGKEPQVFESLCILLEDKPRYHATKVSKEGFELMKKLLKTPIDSLFPCLDIFRMFLIHPQSSEMFKIAEFGMDYLGTILYALREGNV